MSNVVNKSLLGEVVWMAFDTLRTNKMRSGLTILGVVIGITAIVGMTSLIRGFDESLRNSIRELGPNTIILSKISLVNIAGGYAGRAYTAGSPNQVGISASKFGPKAAFVPGEVVVKFRRTDSFREFKDQFRFISTQFYF